MSFFYKIKLRKRTRLRIEQAKHLGMSTRRWPFLWKRNSQHRAFNRTKILFFFPLCSCSLPPPPWPRRHPSFSLSPSLWAMRGACLSSTQGKESKREKKRQQSPSRRARKLSGLRPTTHLAGAAARRVARSGWAGQFPDPRCPHCPRRPRYLRRRHNCPRHLLPSGGSCPSPGRPTWPSNDCRSPVPAAPGPAALAEPPSWAPLETREVGEGGAPGLHRWPMTGWLGDRQPIASRLLGW